MAEGYYARLLGLPADLPAPDYFQMLELDGRTADPQAIGDLILKRMQQLEGAGGGDKDIAEYLKRELQRARATVLDPRTRAEYEEQVRAKRRSDLRKYVEKMVVDRALSSAAEQAIVDRVGTFGIEEAEARHVIEDQLKQLEASRAEDRTLSDGAVAEEGQRLLDVMSQVADQQLVAAVRGPVAAERGTARKMKIEPTSPPGSDVVQSKVTTRRAAPSAEPRRGGRLFERAKAAAAAAQAERAAQAAARTDTSSNGGAESSGGGETAAATLPEAAPEPHNRYPTPPVAPAIEAPTDYRTPTPARPDTGKFDRARVAPAAAEGGDAAKVAQLNERIAVLERQKASLQQQANRTSSGIRWGVRTNRMIIGFALVAAAFGAGDIVASYNPGFAQSINESTIGMRDSAEASQPPAALASISIGVLLAVSVVAFWLAGRERIWAFLAPMGVLCALAFGTGLVPLGDELELEELRTRALSSEDGLRDERKKSATVLESTQKALKDANQRLAAATRELDELKQQIASKEKAMADTLRQRDEELRLAKLESAEIAKQIVVQNELKTEIARLKGDVARHEETIRSLRRENDDLKRRLK